MRDKITATFGADKLEHRLNINFSQIYVIDLTERTKSAKNLEIYNNKPDGIDTLLIENPNLNINATFFQPQCFLDERNKKEYYSQLIQGGEKKEFLDKHKIFIRATNHLKIKNETIIY
ncbi:MAG: hypothetical protein LBG77_09365 [Dysgonamonadaceae bacterium]|jgi:hypothetical protein|nr:hypothetical protein [Dysgonamonadaceae bacterium]